MASNASKPIRLRDVVRIICVFICPPLAVFLTVGLGLQFWINLVLSIMVIPGIIHAVWVIARRA